MRNRLWIFRYFTVNHSLWTIFYRIPVVLTSRATIFLKMTISDRTESLMNQYSGNKIYNSFVIIVKSVTKIVYKTWYRRPTQNEKIDILNVQQLWFSNNIIWIGKRKSKKREEWIVFRFLQLCLEHINQNESTG